MLLGVRGRAGRAGSGLGCKSDKEDPGAVFITRYCDVYKPCCMAAGLPGDGKACRALFASAASPQAKYNATGGRSLPLRVAGDLRRSRASARATSCRPRRAPRRSAARPARASRTTTARRRPRATRDASPVSRTARTSASVRSRSAARSAARRASAACAAASPSTAARATATSPTWAISATRTTASAATAPRCVALAAVGAPCELSERLRRRGLLRRDHRPCAARKPIGAACIGPGARVRGRRRICDEAGLLCAAQLDVGAACSENVQCLTGNCPRRHLPADAADRREPALRGLNR